MSELTYVGFTRAHVALAVASIPAGAKRPTDVRVLLEELRRLCKKRNLNFGLIWAQIWHETDGFMSFVWGELHNPAGIQNKFGSNYMNYYNGVDAARAIVSHVAAYLFANPNDELIEPDLDPRYLIVCDIARDTPTVDAAKLATVAKSWATDPKYAAKVSAWFTRLFVRRGDLLPVLIVAGHRNLSGGNPAEYERTDDLAISYLAACQDRGIRAEWWQQIDRDADPDDSLSYLGAVALGCNDWLQRQPNGGIMLDLHFEGGGQPGVFVVYPDWPGDRNFLDESWSKRIAAAIAAATGLKVRTSGVTSPGSMSETQTGVGGQGYRLGMFGLTAPSREKSIRLVIEHGSLDKAPDAGIINANLSIFARNAAVAAVSAMIGLQS